MRWIFGPFWAIFLCVRPVLCVLTGQHWSTMVSCSFGSASLSKCLLTLVDQFTIIRPGFTKEFPAPFFRSQLRPKVQSTFMSQTRRARVNMADVARESGVSLSTVSMVFGHKPGLPVETRTKVLNAAKSLGYSPRSTSTSSLPVARPGTLRTIGVVMRARLNELPRNDHFYSVVFAGIEGACRDNNLVLLYTTVYSDLENRPLEIPRLLKECGADGLLLVGLYIDEGLYKLIKHTRMPVVLVDSYAEYADFDNVVSDNFNGAYQATCYLIEKGHHKIGFVGGSEHTYPSFSERRRGYLQALRDYQISEAFFADCSSDRDDAVNAIRHLLGEHHELTALVGVNDFVAIIAMHVALELGRRVGDDLSIIGYDDILLAESVIPPLTTMQVDKLAMGRTAVQLLINRAAQPDLARITATMGAHLIERNSIQPLPAGIQVPIGGLP